jgi:hypothetical protein
MTLKKFQKFSIKENTQIDKYDLNEYYWVSYQNELIPARYDGETWSIVGSDEIFYDETSSEFSKYEDAQVKVISKIEKLKPNTIRTGGYSFL